MKKIAVVFLCMSVILSLCACSQRESKIAEPVNFYYCKEEIVYHSASGVIEAEMHEGADFQNDAERMLRAYLQGPHANDNVLLLPDQTNLISLQIVNDRAYVKFTDMYSQLSGIKLTTACSCIAMTLHDYTGVKEVFFSTENELLDNKENFVIRVEDLVWQDVME